MPKEQRLWLILWSIFGFLGLLRAAYGALNGDAFGFVLGLAWLAFGGYKAWGEAKKIDDEALGRTRMQKQPDRPAKAKRK